MTYRELLKELRTEIKDDDELDDEVDFGHLLDWLGCIGVDGAADAYQRTLDLVNIVEVSEVLIEDGWSITMLSTNDGVAHEHTEKTWCVELDHNGFAVWGDSDSLPSAMSIAMLRARDAKLNRSFGPAVLVDLNQEMPQTEN